jgi:DNA polymerase III delta prime subunit
VAPFFTMRLCSVFHVCSLQSHRVFRFDKPDLGRLTTRLQEICNKVSIHSPPVSGLLLLTRSALHQEGLRADTQTVMALCNLADHDIRSCLNTLQVRQPCTGAERCVFDIPQC